MNDLESSSKPQSINHNCLKQNLILGWGLNFQWFRERVCTNLNPSHIKVILRIHTKSTCNQIARSHKGSGNMFIRIYNFAVLSVTLPFDSKKRSGICFELLHVFVRLSIVGRRFPRLMYSVAKVFRPTAASASSHDWTLSSEQKLFQEAENFVTFRQTLQGRRVNLPSSTDTFSAHNQFSSHFSAHSSCCRITAKLILQEMSTSLPPRCHQRSWALCVFVWSFGSCNPRLTSCYTKLAVLTAHLAFTSDAVSTERWMHH